MLYRANPASVQNAGRVLNKPKTAGRVQNKHVKIIIHRVVIKLGSY